MKVILGAALLYVAARAAVDLSLLPRPISANLVAIGTRSAHLAVAQPQLTGAVCIGLVLWLLAGWARSALALKAPRDPRRLFTGEERRAGFRRAGYRCEFDAWFGLTRCRRPAEHGDHWWPHARGGATSMANLVAACARHNTAKGAVIPTSARTRRIARRRRGYFPGHEPGRPGQRYRVTRLAR